VVDDLSTGKRENLSGAGAAADLVEADIRDSRGMRDLIDRVRPQVVFHLAAQIDVRKSTADPAWDAGINVLGTINLLQASLEARVDRFVNTSTGGAIYGEGRILPAPEDHPQAPEAPYGQSKFCAEGYCDLYSRLHGLSTVSLRYGNVYGPRQDPLGEAGVIAIFCGKLLADEEPTIFGTGEQTRDYVYVGDVVRANLAAAESRATGAFNVGLGVQTSVLQLVEALREISGKDAFEAELAPPRLGEVQHIAIDPARACGELGWEPQITLRDGLERTLASLR
jgi:UDP-glucose 4-epimerase